MTVAILTGLFLCLIGVVLWCLRQMRGVLHEHRDKFMGGTGPAFGHFIGAAASAAGAGIVLHRLFQVLQ